MSEPEGSAIPPEIIINNLEKMKKKIAKWEDS